MAADAEGGWRLEGVKSLGEETIRGVLLVSRRPGRCLGRIAESRIRGFLCCPARLAAIEEVAGSEPSVCRLRVASLRNGEASAVSMFLRAHRATVRAALRGPQTDALPHCDLSACTQDLVTAPRAFCLLQRGESGGRKHVGFVVRALGARFPQSLRGLRWVVEGCQARLVLFRPSAGSWALGAEPDDAAVVERRGDEAPWVRAGVGSVVAPSQHWAAVVGCQFVAAFDLWDGAEVLHAEFDPRPLGRLWLAAVEACLLVAFPDGELAVFAPVLGQRRLREVSRHGVGQDALYAVADVDVLAVAVKAGGGRPSSIQLYHFDKAQGRSETPFAVLDPLETIPGGPHCMLALAVTANHVVTESAAGAGDGHATLRVWRRDTQDLIFSSDTPSGRFLEVAAGTAHDSAALQKILLRLDEEPSQFKEVEDEEPARGIPPQEAADVAEELWASRIERRLRTEWFLAQGGRGPVRPDPEKGLGRFGLKARTEGVVLLTYSRHPRQLEEALNGSSAACAAVDRGVNTRPDWANGAKVFVEGLNREALVAAGVEELCPRHVLVKAEDEEAVQASLQVLSYRVRPRLKPGVGRRELGDQASGSGGSSLFRGLSEASE
jgi:hypothetical protein